MNTTSRNTAAPMVSTKFTSFLTAIGANDSGGQFDGSFECKSLRNTSILQAKDGFYRPTKCSTPFKTFTDYSRITPEHVTKAKPKKRVLELDEQSDEQQILTLNAENLSRLNGIAELDPTIFVVTGSEEDLVEFSFVCEPSTSEPDDEKDNSDVSMLSTAALNDSVSSAHFVQKDAVNKAEIISNCAKIKVLDTLKTMNNVSA